jgi:hypothetical protein
MNRNELIIVAAVVTTLLAVTSLAAYANGVMQYWSPQQHQVQNQGYGPAGGMMGGGYNGGAGGMMGGYGGGMMMGGDGYYQGVPSAALTHADTEQVAQTFLASLSNPDLQIGDFDEYSHNFYLSIVDKNTGNGVLEVLIDRFTGYVHPEPQSMMWISYGGMGSMMGYGGGSYYQGNGEAVTVSPDQAKEIAQAFLNITYPGTVASDTVDTFPGYYTIETALNGETYGMLSVNGYTGAVWYHTWHGMFISALD